MTSPTPPSPCALAGERGSVILISIVLVFVMTLLGLALFELGAIENRMSLSSAADARAFEVAQGGSSGPSASSRMASTLTPRGARAGPTTTACGPPSAPRPASPGRIGR